MTCANKHKGCCYFPFSLSLVYNELYHGWRNLFQSGGHKCKSKKYIKFLWFELATVRSQALKYDVIAYALYEGLNSTIFGKITPLWKRIGEPPEIQIGCYSGEPGPYDLFWLSKTVWRLRHWDSHLLSFWLALLLLCDVSHVIINESFSW